MTFGSLFAGIGGFDLGFEAAGMECKWQVEKAEFPLAVLKKHWPDVPKYREVRDVGRQNLESVDVICGGFPCQPFSRIGRGEAEADERNLWPQFIRVVKELGPRWIVVENVPRIIKLYLDTISSDLEGAGYSPGAIGLPAAAFGAPHERERIFIIARQLANADNIRLERILSAWTEKGAVGRSSRAPAGMGTVPELRRFPLQPAHEARPRVRLSADRGVADRPILSFARWDEAPPRLFGVVNGISSRVDRFRALGNAVVPQVAQYIAEGIILVESELQRTLI